MQIVTLLTYFRCIKSDNDVLSFKEVLDFNPDQWFQKKYWLNKTMQVKYFWGLVPYKYMQRSLQYVFFLQACFFPIEGQHV